MDKTKNIVFIIIQIVPENHKVEIHGVSHNCEKWQHSDVRCDLTINLADYEILYANNVQNQTGSVSADAECEF